MNPFLSRLGNFLAFLLFSGAVYGQTAAVTFTLQTPAGTKAEKGVFIAGSFNYWHAADSLYRLKDLGNGLYTITLPVFDKMHYSYKYTLGSWDKVEVDTRDSSIANRQFTAANRHKIIDTVLAWKTPASKGDSSAQLKKLAAMKDSLLNSLKPELAAMQENLKAYVQNMLQANPDKKLHDQLDEKTAEKIGVIYKKITLVLWNICSSLSPEQKQKISQALQHPVNNDYLNTFLNAITGAAK